MLKTQSISAKEIGIRIRILREERHICQENLAQTLNVSRELISKIEGGRQFPSVVVLAQLSLCFQVSTDYLLLGSGHKPDLAQKLDQVIFILKSLRQQL